MKQIIENILFKNGYKNNDGVWIKEEENRKNYTDNFGLQWNEFQKTQLDSYTQTNAGQNRLFDCSGWQAKELGNGSLILELGSGAGRFTEILLKHGAFVVSVEMSDAIYANKSNNSHENVIFIKESLFNLDFFNEIFDFVLCFGVAQHTPNPSLCYNLCCNYAKAGGKISIDHYRKLYYPTPYYHPKYLWRPLTKRMEPQKLLNLIRWYIPKYLPFDTFLIRYLPYRFSHIIRGLIPIPCWNYYGNKNVPQDKDQLCEWAIMDSFDALGAVYDTPFSKKDIDRIVSPLKLSFYEIKQGGNGLIFNAIK